MGLHIHLCRLTMEEPMPTNLALDDKLIEEAVKIGKHLSKRAAVTEALKEYVSARKRLGILKWIGRVDYDEAYDYKKARKRRASS